MFKVIAVGQDVADVETDGKSEFLHDVFNPFERICEGLYRNPFGFDSVIQNLS